MLFICVFCAFNMSECDVDQCVGGEELVCTADVQSVSFIRSFYSSNSLFFSKYMRWQFLINYGYNWINLNHFYGLLIVNVLFTYYIYMYKSTICSDNVIDNST